MVWGHGRARHARPAGRGGLDRGRLPRPGDTARLRLTGEGMALVSVLSDRVIDMQLVELAGEVRNHPARDR